MPPALSAEIERELERLALVKQPMKLIEANDRIGPSGLGIPAIVPIRESVTVRR